MIGPMILVGLCGLLAPQFVGALREFGQLRSDVINHELHLAPTTLKAGLFDDTFLQGVEDKLEAMKAEYDTQREDHPTGDFSLPGVDNPLSAEDAENFERKLQDAEKQDQTILKEALAWHKKLREEFEAIQSAKNCQETESVHVAAEQTVAQRYPNHDNMMTLAKEPQRFSWPCWNWKKSLFGQFLKGMPELVLMLYAGEWGAKGVAFGLQRNQIAMPGILGGGHPIDPSRDVVNPTAMMGGTLNVIVFVLLPPALRAWYAKKPDDSDAWLGIKDTKGQFLVQRNGEWVELDPVDLVPGDRMRYLGESGRTYIMPVDGLVVHTSEGAGAAADEAPMTGETTLVKKEAMGIMVNPLVVLEGPASEPLIVADYRHTEDRDDLQRQPHQWLVLRSFAESREFKPNHERAVNTEDLQEGDVILDPPTGYLPEAVDLRTQFNAVYERYRHAQTENKLHQDRKPFTGPVKLIVELADPVVERETGLEHARGAESLEVRLRPAGVRSPDLALKAGVSCMVWRGTPVVLNAGKIMELIVVNTGDDTAKGKLAASASGANKVQRATAVAQWAASLGDATWKIAMGTSFAGGIIQGLGHHALGGNLPLTVGYTFVTGMSQAVPKALVAWSEMFSLTYGRLVEHGADATMIGSNGDLPRLASLTHLFSDKTGTLTRNEQELAGVVVYVGETERARGGLDKPLRRLPVLPSGDVSAKHVQEWDAAAEYDRTQNIPDDFAQVKNFVKSMMLNHDSAFTTRSEEVWVDGEVLRAIFAKMAEGGGAASQLYGVHRPDSVDFRTSDFSEWMRFVTNYQYTPVPVPVAAVQQGRSWCAHRRTRAPLTGRAAEMQTVLDQGGLGPAARGAVPLLATEAPPVVYLTTAAPTPVCQMCGRTGGKSLVIIFEVPKAGAQEFTAFSLFREIEKAYKTEFEKDPAIGTAEKIEIRFRKQGNAMETSVVPAFQQLGSADGHLRIPQDEQYEKIAQIRFDSAWKYSATLGKRKYSTTTAEGLTQERTRYRLAIKGQPGSLVKVLFGGLENVSTNFPDRWEELESLLTEADALGKAEAARVLIAFGIEFEVEGDENVREHWQAQLEDLANPRREVRNKQNPLLDFLPRRSDLAWRVFATNRGADGQLQEVELGTVTAADSDSNPYPLAEFITAHGLLISKDQIKARTKEGIEDLQNPNTGLGVQVYMLTGDHPPTALAIGIQAGLVPETATLSSVLNVEELNLPKNEEQARTVSGRWNIARLCFDIIDVTQKIGSGLEIRYKIFTKATPFEKAIIVDCARRLLPQHSVVGMMGDGDNDSVPMLVGALKPQPGDDWTPQWRLLMARYDQLGIRDQIRDGAEEVEDDAPEDITAGADGGADVEMGDRLTEAEERAQRHRGLGAGQMLSKSERALAKPALAEEKLPDADQNHYAENLLLAKAQARNNGWVYGISFENAQPAAIRNSQIMLNNNDGPDRKYPEITGLGQAIRHSRHMVMAMEKYVYFMTAIILFRAVGQMLWIKTAGGLGQQVVTAQAGLWMDFGINWLMVLHMPAIYRYSAKIQGVWSAATAIYRQGRMILSGKRNLYTRCGGSCGCVAEQNIFLSDRCVGSPLRFRLHVDVSPYRRHSSTEGMLMSLVESLMLVSAVSSSLRTPHMPQAEAGTVMLASIFAMWSGALLGRELRADRLAASGARFMEQVPTETAGGGELSRGYRIIERIKNLGLRTKTYTVMFTLPNFFAAWFASWAFKGTGAVVPFHTMWADPIKWKDLSEGMLHSFLIMVVKHIGEAALLKLLTRFSAVPERDFWATTIGAYSGAVLFNSLGLAERTLGDQAFWHHVHENVAAEMGAGLVVGGVLGFGIRRGLASLAAKWRARSRAEWLESDPGSIQSPWDNDSPAEELQGRGVVEELQGVVRRELQGRVVEEDPSEESRRSDGRVEMLPLS